MTQLMNQEPQKQEHPTDLGRGELTRDVATFVPRIDIWENDDEIVMFGDLPGVDKDDLDIQFENRQLTIHGKVQPQQSSGKLRRRQNTASATFTERFRSVTPSTSDKISAELKNGVLALHLPKSESVKPRKIAVKAG